MPAYAIGVDLGGTSLRVAAVDGRGRILEKITVASGSRCTSRQALGAMCDAIARLRSKHRRLRFLGAGIAVAGILDIEAGVLRSSPNLPRWRNVPLRRLVGRRLGGRFTLENDANAAALGESWIGAGSKHKTGSLLMITLGTGVGGGIVLDGEVWHGASGMAGELGHITVDPGGPRCGCGSRGCLEQYASATAIARMARKAGLRARSAEQLHQLATMGNAKASEVFRGLGQALGVAVAGLVNIFDPALVVIGGGVAGAWEFFSPAMMEEVRKRSFVYAAGKNIICNARLSSDAGLIGAARLAMRNQRG